MSQIKTQDAKIIDIQTMIFGLMILHKNKFNEVPIKIRQLVSLSFLDALCRASKCNPMDLKKEEKEWIESVAGISFDQFVKSHDR